MSLEVVLMASSPQHLCVLYYGNNVVMSHSASATTTVTVSSLFTIDSFRNRNASFLVSTGGGGGLHLNSSDVSEERAVCFKWPNLLLVTRKTEAAHSSETLVQSFLWTRFKNLKKTAELRRGAAYSGTLAVGEFMAATSGMWNEVYMIDGERVTEI
jgi:hypothetical protein